jgi:hypothetical protein
MVEIYKATPTKGTSFREAHTTRARAPNFEKLLSFPCSTQTTHEIAWQFFDVRAIIALNGTQLIDVTISDQ